MKKNECQCCNEVVANDEMNIIVTPDGGELLICEDCCRRQVESIW